MVEVNKTPISVLILPETQPGRGQGTGPKGISLWGCGSSCDEICFVASVDWICLNSQLCLYPALPFHVLFSFSNARAGWCSRQTERPLQRSECGVRVLPGRMVPSWSPELRVGRMVGQGWNLGVGHGEAEAVGSTWILNKLETILMASVTILARVRNNSVQKLIPLQTEKNVSFFCAAARIHADFHNPGCRQKPGWCPWSVCATAGCYEQGGIFCSGVDGCRLITGNERLWGLPCQPPPNKRNNPDMKLLKRVPKNCEEDAEV